jgi:hypothetical protein
MSPTVQAFFAALAKRRIDFKTAAYLGGGHAKALSRLHRGETRTLDAAFVARLAQKLDDGTCFLAEVFGSASVDPLAGIRADLAFIKQAVSNAPAAWWFDENGRRFAAVPDFETAARMALNLPQGIDAAAFAQRNLGWVAVESGKIVPSDAPAVLAAEAAAAFVGRPKLDLPRGWKADAAPLVLESRPALRRLVSANGISGIRDALFGAQLLDRASLYAVDADRVTTIWLGRDLKTAPDAIGRPLAARSDRPFAAMLERQIRATVSGGAKLWRLSNIQTCGVRATYDRIAVPTQDGRFVAHVVEFKAIEATGAHVPTPVIQ